MTLCDKVLGRVSPDAAGSASEGLRLFARGGYDQVMTDFTAPEANGLQLIQSVRDCDPSVGSVVLTVFAVELVRQRQRFGFELVPMPVDLTGFTTAVREVLASRTPSGD
jgi:DNA-binding NtrC family response regulator